MAFCGLILFKGELLGKNEVILDVWPWNHVSLFDNFIYEQFLTAQIIYLIYDFYVNKQILYRADYRARWKSPPVNQNCKYYLN